MPTDQTPPASKWDDLQVRLISAAGMLVVGLVAIYLGGAAFQLLVVFALGLMIWELTSLCDPERPNAAIVLAVMACAFGSVLHTLEGIYLIAVMLTPCILGAVFIGQRRQLFLVFSIAIFLATYSMVHFRNMFGADWIMWIILVIIASDTLGYLAGRAFGGPKFWPKISPKKTWSGTVAGWIGAAVVGAIFARYTNSGAALIVISALVAFAGQMGDIAESALKRRVGSKDSSDLIPGHGGLLDRFDAMLGATLVLGILIIGFGYTGVAF